MAQERITDMAAASPLLGGELFELSQLSTTVKITAATISAASADNSFNDSAFGFIAAGFAVNDRVRVSGFTGNVANNILVGTITALTTDKMTIGGTDGDVIVTDAEGESVTIAKWKTVQTSLADVVGLAGSGSASLSPVQTEAGNYTVLADDAGNFIRLTGAVAKTVTVGPDAGEAMPANGEWHFRNVGAGNATLVAGSGVTINAPAGGTLAVEPGGTVTLKRAAVNVFDLLGQTVSA